MKKYLCLVAILGGVVVAPPMAVADGPQCPFFKPDCCSKPESSCNLPEGCSCSEFDVEAAPKDKRRKFAKRGGTMSKKDVKLPSNMTGTWRVTGSVPSAEPRCTYVCDNSRPRNCSRRCGPTPPPNNTCSFAVTNKTFTVVARETSRGVTARIDERITLSGYRSGASSIIMAGTAFYPEYGCTANVTLTISPYPFSRELSGASATVNWSCSDARRSCYVKYAGTIDQL